MTDRAARWTLAAAVVAAWATSFLGGFQLDDWVVVVGDPRVQDLGAWWRSMPGIRPLLKLTWALDHASGAGLVGFHAVNVAIHVGSALLAYALLRDLGARTGASVDHARRAALVGSLLFALHPAQTEAVTYVSGRSASLSGMLALASVLLWIRGRARERPWPGAASGGAPGPMSRPVRGSLGGVTPEDLASALLFGAAVAVKETAIFLPVALVVVAATDPRPAPARPGRRTLAAITPHLVLALIAAAALLASPTYRRMLAWSFGLRDALANVTTQLAAIGWLAGQVVRPDRLDADPDLPTVPHADLSIVLIAAVLVTIAAAGVLLRRRRPVLAFACLWTLVWLAPAGWFVPRPEPASDRQLYLALLGPSWLLGWGLAGPLGTARPLARPVTLALVALLAGLTATRNLVYRDEVRFWSDVVARSPGNPRAHNNLAVALAAACRRPEAEAALLRALEHDPGHLRAAVNLQLLREGAPLERRAPVCEGAAATAPSPGPVTPPSSPASAGRPPGRS